MFFQTNDRSSDQVSVRYQGYFLLEFLSSNLINQKMKIPNMVYDEGLAQRIREYLSDELGVSEKKMFGGVAFMIGGNMACGVVNDQIII